MAGAPGGPGSASPIHVLLGPTASGKTALSLPLAERIGAEIVCLDSRQVFRGMEIGTAQPTPEEQARVPHHLFGVITPGARFSAGDYGRLARSTLAGIEARGAGALFVGGAGLYLRALAGGLARDLPHDEALRQELRARAAREGNAALHAELAALDPEAAERFHPNDTQRVTRALEVVRLTGERLADLQSAEGEGAELAPRLRLVVLERPRDVLYRRIARRTRELLAGGMIEEVERQLAGGLDPAWPGFRAHGYPEIAAYRAGRIDRDTMEARLNQVTRNYVKRQFTWFRRLKGAEWLALSDDESPERGAERAVALFQAAGPVSGV